MQFDPYSMGGAPTGGAMPPQISLPAEGPPQGGGGSATDMLRQAIDAVRSYADQENDDINTEKAMKVMAALQAILAAEQKEEEAALGASPASRYLKRASSAAPSGY